MRTSQESNVYSSEWRLFLQREDCEMALGHEDILRGLKKFESVPSRDQRRSLENDVFRISLDHVSLSINQVALLTSFFAGCDVRCPVLGWSAGRPKGKELGHPRPP